MRARLVPFLVLIVLGAIAVGAFVFESRPRWKRDHPLQGATQVERVENGVITLAGGEHIRPAGIREAPGLGPGEFDIFLRVATAQGVVIERQVDDSSALLQVEPRFWNWCGTSQRSKNWAGSYLQSPLSELAIICGVADPDLAQPGLSDQESERLAACEQLRPGVEMSWVRPDLNAIMYDIGAMVRDLDLHIEFAIEDQAP